MRPWTFALFLLLSGCGGDGGEPSPILPPPTVEPPPEQQPEPPPPSVPADTPDAPPPPQRTPTQTVPVGTDTTVTLPPSDTPLVPNWVITEKPEGSMSVIGDVTAETPTLIPDLSGTYVLESPGREPVVILALAEPITLHVLANHIGGTITIDGIFTYDRRLGPKDSNVRGLSPNAIWELIAWDLTATNTGTSSFPPTKTFSNALPGHTAELCNGICLFSRNQVSQVRFYDPGDNLLIELDFFLADPTPFETPPASVSEWGPLLQGLYRVPCPICGPVAVFESGVTLSQQ